MISVATDLNGATLETLAYSAQVAVELLFHGLYGEWFLVFGAENDMRVLLG